MKPIPLMIVIALIPGCGFAQSANNLTPVKPLFVKAKCDGPLLAEVLNSFKQSITDSKHYVIMSRLDEYGLNKTSAYVSMICTERGGTVAVASVFGEAHCLGTNDCRAGIDGRSLGVTLCEGKAASECGEQLYVRFIEWTQSPAPKFAGN